MMLLQSIDSLKSAADTLLNSEKAKEVFNKIEFNPSNLLQGEGIFISIVGYLVVFLSLLLLYMVFVNLTKFLQLRLRKRLKKGGENVEEKEDFSVSGEINAAVSTALYLYLEEIENLDDAILTIKKVQKIYSPWSSKIYGLRQFPKK
jgi:glutaconyl-CoA/methylmalonyl-CoA decarboxylase subunit delta